MVLPLENCFERKEGFLRLWNTFNNEQLTLEQLLLRSAVARSKIFVAQEQQSREVVGFVCVALRYSVLTTALYFEVEAIFVKDSKRRMGWGRLLVEHIRTVAKTFSASGIHVSAAIGPEAELFYSQLGFTKYAHRYIDSNRP